VTDDDNVAPPAKPMPAIVVIILGSVAALALAFSLFSHSWLYADATQLQYRDDSGMMYTEGRVHEMAMGLRSLERCSSDGKVCEAMAHGTLLEDWERELIRARFMADEPVEDEAKALLGDDELSSLKATRAADRASDPVGTLERAQRQLIIAKRVYTSSGTWTMFGSITWIAVLLAAISLLAAVGIVVAKRRVRLPVMPTTTALLGVLIALITGCLFVATKPGPPGYVGVGLGFFVFGAGVVLGLWSSLALNKLMRPHDPDLLEDAMKADEF
jgi:hypothetical protein